jgi:hypothetical protein
MKTLELEKMEIVEGGFSIGIFLGCVALGVVTASPVVGLVCNAAFNSQELH